MTPRRPVMNSKGPWSGPRAPCASNATARSAPRGRPAEARGQGRVQGVARAAPVREEGVGEEGACDQVAAVRPATPGSWESEESEDDAPRVPEDDSDDDSDDGVPCFYGRTRSTRPCGGTTTMCLNWE